MSVSKTLEINPDHPVIYQIYKKVKESTEDESAKKTAGLLTQAAILASGYRLEDPSNIVSSVQRLLKTRRGADLSAPVTEVEIPADLNDDEKPAAAEEAVDDDEDGADAEEEEAE